MMAKVNGVGDLIITFLRAEPNGMENWHLSILNPIAGCLLASLLLTSHHNARPVRQFISKVETKILKFVLGTSSPPHVDGRGKFL